MSPDSAGGGHFSLSTVIISEMSSHTSKSYNSLRPRLAVRLVAPGVWDAGCAKDPEGPLLLPQNKSKSGFL